MKPTYAVYSIGWFTSTLGIKPRLAGAIDLVYNMVQDLISAAEWRAEERGKKKGYKYEVRINENIAIGLFKERFIRLILEEDDNRKDAMFMRLTADMERNIVPVRKLKSAPRKWKYFNKYKCNQKPSF